MGVGTFLVKERIPAAQVKTVRRHVGVEQKIGSPEKLPDSARRHREHGDSEGVSQNSMSFAFAAEQR